MSDTILAAVVGGFSGAIVSAIGTFVLQRHLLNRQERFQREAKSLALLSHPNIVKLFSFGINDQGDIVGHGERASPKASLNHRPMRRQLLRHYQRMQVGTVVAQSA